MYSLYFTIKTRAVQYRKRKYFSINRNSIRTGLLESAYLSTKNARFPVHFCVVQLYVTMPSFAIVPSVQ